MQRILGGNIKVVVVGLLLLLQKANFGKSRLIVHKNHGPTHSFNLIPKSVFNRSISESPPLLGVLELSQDTPPDWQTPLRTFLYIVLSNPNQPIPRTASH
jgi:hypothetical protein